MNRANPVQRLILLLATVLVTFTFSYSQSPPKRKKVKDFGSSLPRLKWNPEKNAAEMRSGKQNANADEEDIIRIETSLVSSDLLVLDRYGKSVAGLVADDFAITEDGVPQTVGHFFNGDNVDVPRTIVLLIDYSGSQQPYLRNSVNAAKLLVDKLRPKDLMAIVTDDVELLIDFTADKEKLKDKLDSLLDRRFGRSKQYSAVMATLNELFTEEDVRRIIIFQTDGDEAYFMRNPLVGVSGPPLKGAELERAQRSLPFYMLNSVELEFSLNDIYRAVERERVTLYTVIPGPRLWGLPPEEQIRRGIIDHAIRKAEMKGRLSEQQKAAVRKKAETDRKTVDERVAGDVEKMSKLQAILASVATVSGGWADFLEEPDQADAIYSRIFSDINQRYIVGYYPTNKERDGKRRKLEFKVKGHPEYQVYGRLSYFAPEP